MSSAHTGEQVECLQPFHSYLMPKPRRAGLQLEMMSRKPDQVAHQRIYSYPTYLAELNCCSFSRKARRCCHFFMGRQ